MDMTTKAAQLDMATAIHVSILWKRMMRDAKITEIYEVLVRYMYGYCWQPIEVIFTSKTILIC